MIEVVLFHEEADPSREAGSSESSTAEPPASAEPAPALTGVGQAYWEFGAADEPVGIFVDVEDGDPLSPAEEVVLDVAVF
jgi:hypothetical protein